MSAKGEEKILVGVLWNGDILKNRENKVIIYYALFWLTYQPKVVTNLSPGQSARAVKSRVHLSREIRPMPPTRVLDMTLPRVHLSRGIRPMHSTSVLAMTKPSDGKAPFLELGACGVPLHFNYYQFHSDQ